MKEDIQIEGYQNSVVVAKELPNTIDKGVLLGWHAIKPDGVGSKNPSDVVIKLVDGTYVGILLTKSLVSDADATQELIQTSLRSIQNWVIKDN